MRIVTLVEDTCPNPSLILEHGLSLYIETGGHKILFDTGQSSVFMQNAQALGIDLSGVDFAVLSHAHYDHSGGINPFLSVNDRAKIYVSSYTFDDIRHGDSYIGPDKALQNNPRLVFVSDKVRLAEGVTVHSGNQRIPSQPIQSYGLTAMRNGARIPDDFRHEQYLEIVENNKRILISGCSHKGIVNIVRWFKPDVLVGGFHLFNLDPQGEGREELDTVARELMNTDAKYYTCHCTGVPQYEYLRHRLRDQIVYISAGQEITI